MFKSALNTTSVASISVSSVGVQKALKPLFQKRVYHNTNLVASFKENLDLYPLIQR